MSPLELVDDRFGKLAEELRASRPIPSEALRERVHALGEPEPSARRWAFGLHSRRVALALAFAGLAASFVAAGLTGLPHSKSHNSATRGFHPVLTPGAYEADDNAASGRALRALPQALKSAGTYSSFAPVAGRLQRYEATLRLRVKNVDALSSASKQAMSLARRLGGYVSSVQYSTRGGKRGGATLVLRVPVGNVQTALAGLTSLGTILQQQTGILDVTRRVDREAQQIAKLEGELKTAGPSEAPGIRHRLQTLRAKHARLLKSARLARITLSLTTPARQVAAAPTRFDRTLDDAGAVLLRELEFLLYALVVAGPLLLLGGAGIAAARGARRRGDRRLLERV